jgi:hypothetical protein
MSAGLFVILVGVILICWQFYIEAQLVSFIPQQRSMQLDPTGGFKVQTTYVGLVVLAIGAALEIIGYTAASPWRKE